MSKTKMTVRQILDAHQQNCERIREIADLCEKENRLRNEKEDNEYEQLQRENQMLSMRLQVETAQYTRENPNAREEAENIIRENVKAGRKTEINLVRDIMTVTDVKSGSVVPLNVQDILQPLVEGFILDKVGLPMPTGLAGDYVWPVYEMIEANIYGEGAAITDSKIPFSKLTAQPARIGVAVPVSQASITQSNGVIETIVRKILPQSIRLLLNKILFSTEAANTVAAANGLVGPFVGKTPITGAATFAKLNELKARILETGVEGGHLCFTMTESMKALLEGAPINSEGVYMPVVNNDKACGLPIYCTNSMRKVQKSYKKYNGSTWADYVLTANDTVAHTVSSEAALAGLSASSNDIAEIRVVTEYIGVGDWRYQPMGLFGQIRFTVDPYSLARKDAVDFVLNCEYGTKTLRPEAFALLQVTNA